MELRTLSTTGLKVTPVGLGTWVMGGWMWGGADENDAQEAIHVSLDHGVTLIDTAPIYGFGKAEEIVGKALKKHQARESIVLATKFGLEWDDNRRIRRNTSREQLLKEIEESLQRLQTDYIDIYQVHWPDRNTPHEETMHTLHELYNKGTIKAIGLSNYNVEQIEAARQYAPVHVLQPPFNLFEQDAAVDILPHCAQEGIETLTYGSLCRGLLTGKFSVQSTFKKGDLRKSDPKFKGPLFKQHLKAVDTLQEYAQSKGSTIIQLVMEWTIHQQGVTCALMGARNRQQAESNCSVLHSSVFSQNDYDEVDRIVEETLAEHVGPEFMAPPK